ncbi:MAG TPA: 16S rRNA (adenine(1518)-N(6)/adenine(1519)-N(6))-dimethyltransferase RsmA [Anaerolineales bacterium]|nr:16S rRNA (adenine(1518)-N(6)/adenine(1519)-N(6))-dimethyltransferase RsmA [Anaerolineae bacterium]HIP87462.1 16S rRNA (adenine(1518)-N(6)/adenine(1519)-N(6))-dimethyltransferase RsmA [Anaerolineales bacterium]
MRDETRRLLQRYDLWPRKRLGQHFLVDESALARIVAAAELSPDEAVLEVGAGLGTLTRTLAEAAGHVVAVEVDPHLVAVLSEELADLANVRLIEGDILELDPAALMEERPYKVVANLPYGITAAVLRHLLEARVPPDRMVVTVQREVAERIIAREGRMSLLAVSVHFYGEPQILFRLKPGAFYPRPGVESAVLRIDRHSHPPVEVERVADFFRVVRAGFCQPRKQLRNSLAAGLGISPQEAVEALRRAGIDPHLRAERLRLEEWGRLANALTR